MGDNGSPECLIRLSKFNIRQSNCQVHCSSAKWDSLCQREWDSLHNHKENAEIVFINHQYPPIFGVVFILGAPDRSSYTWALPSFYSPHLLSPSPQGEGEEYSWGTPPDPARGKSL